MTSAAPTAAARVRLRPVDAQGVAIRDGLLAQAPDGYLNSWCQVLDPSWRWTDLEMGRELYCAGHLIQARLAT